jgi:hypothetical protein
MGLEWQASHLPLRALAKCFGDHLAILASLEVALAVVLQILRP